MSGNIASRYIGGVPYGPGRSVGRYPNANSAETAPGVVNFPTVNPAVGAAGGGDVVAQQVADVSGAGGSGSEGGGNMLASLLLGLLGSAPDLYRAGKDLFGDKPAEQTYGPGDNVFDPGSTFTGPGGVQIPNASLGGLGSDFNQVFEPGTMTEVPGGASRILDGAPSAGEGYSPNGGSGGVDLGAAGSDGVGALANTGGLTAAQAGDPLYGVLGENPLFGGDLASGIAGMGGAALGGWIAGQAPWTDRGYGEIGSQAGSALGGIGTGALIGSAFGPIGTAFGALGGALLGGWAGGAAGSEIGPLPTIGRNFSSIGTIGGDGNIYWGNSGGDNGGTGADAQGFSNWFGQNLLQQAAQQGLQFNPNMAGAQFRVGAYDNFSRGGPSPAGGYFYTPDAVGGSPENYALRPSDDFASNPYSADQAGAFGTSVLADLTARGVFTQPGATQPGMDYWNQSQGSPLGWYGAPGGAYSQTQFGGGDFNSILGDRQNAITGWVNQQRAQGETNAAAEQVLGANYLPGTQYDPNYGWQGLAAQGADAPITWASNPTAMAAMQANGGA